MTTLQAIETVYWTTLHADVTLMALLGDSNGIYFDIVPDDAVLPAVLIRVLPGDDYTTQGARGLTTFPLLAQAIGTGLSKIPLYTIMERVDTLTHNVRTTLGSAGSGYFVRPIRTSESFEYTYEEGTRFNHCQMMYNVNVQPQE